MKFKDIEFGRVAAETELEECPELLVDGFIDQFNLIDQIVHRNIFLISGQKGSGKSAIGSKLVLEYSDSDEVVVKYSTLEDLDYNMFEQFDSNKGLKIERFNKSWNTILQIAVLDHLNKNLDSVEFTSNTKEVIEFLKNRSVLPSEHISNIIIKASKKSLVNLKVYQQESSQECTDVPYDQMNEILKNAVNTCKVYKQHIILIDGLDSVITSTNRQYEILSSLLYVVSQVNKQLRDNDISLKFVIFCRTDMLNRMSGPNKQKIVEDFGRRISWYQEGDDVRDVNLIRMINARASISSGEDIDIFDYYRFPDNINGKNIRKFLLDHTRHIPRDMIRLIKQIQVQNDSDTISKNRILSSITNYSKYYFKGELEDELDGFVSKDDVKNFFKILPNLPKYILSVKEMKEVAESMDLKINLNSLLPALFDVGAIGMVRYYGNKKRVMFKYRDDSIDYNILNDIILHMALQNIAKSQGGSLEMIDPDKINM